MKKILILIFLVWLLSSCWNTNLVNNINNNKNIIESKVINNLKTVWPSEFKKELAKNDWVLIDLRTFEEVSNWVIPWVKLNLDYYSTNFKEELNSLDKNKKYLIYCRSGHRSGNTFELMKKLWFKNVINLNWWINNWIKNWLNIEKL